MKFVVLLLFVVLALSAGPCVDSNNKPVLKKSDYAVSGHKSFSSQSGVTISNIWIDGGSGDCVTLTSCQNVVIANSVFLNCKGVGIKISGGKNVSISNNYFENVASAVYVQQATGSIKMNNNYVKNVVGPKPRGQMIQFNSVSGSNHLISKNYMVNILGSSNPEDLINIYKSNGVSSSPITISNNYLIGGGPSPSGGGIMNGDNGGSWISCLSNIVVDPGQYGIAVASGTNILVSKNTILGKQQSFTNVGLYIWKQTDSTCGSDTLRDNGIYFVNKKGVVNNYFDGKNCPNTTASNNFNLGSYRVPSIPSGVGLPLCPVEEELWTYVV